MIWMQFGGWTYLEIMNCFLLICAFNLIELIFYRDKNVLRNFGAFLLVPVIVFVIGILALLLFSPDIVYNILGSGIKNATGFATSLSYSINLELRSYGNLGWLGLIFALVGIIAILKRRSKKDIFLLSWMIVIILILNASFFWYRCDFLSFTGLSFNTHVDYWWFWYYSDLS